MNTCFECGAEMVLTRESYQYDASGLRGITLANIQIGRCPNCGDVEVCIPKIADLHRSIALSLVQKAPTLAPDEIRYLRGYLQLDE